jgi:hypothetical protein
MQIFILESDVEPRLQGISHDPTGDNLPATLVMAWRHQSHGRTTTIDSLYNDLSAAIRREGFVLLSPIMGRNRRGQIHRLSRAARRPRETFRSTRCPSRIRTPFGRSTSMTPAAAGAGTAEQDSDRGVMSVSAVTWTGRKSAPTGAIIWRRQVNRSPVLTSYRSATHWAMAPGAKAS